MKFKHWKNSGAVLAGCLLAALSTTAFAQTQPAPGCCATITCGNLTVTDCIGPCRVGHKCFGDGDCGPPAWAMAECRPNGGGGTK